MREHYTNALVMEGTGRLRRLARHGCTHYSGWVGLISTIAGVLISYSNCAE